ncbi:MAG: carboxypeptidase regulatory-like domain-containing protein [Acidobacteria bacterium]|nr:carboxypeptidase regulatory-like domain-containing protein [Acidobacteriota bacterium]MBI3427078.1 carboxypeptidase regulatory-like domain-containing protein [Acidobacteriota bacterium]
MKTKRCLGLFAASIILLAVASFGTAWAQTETGQIIGKVADPNGAVIPAASITVKSTGTGAERTATTGSDGVYVITNLQPGIYSVTVKAKGFADSSQQVNITVGAKISLDTAMSLTAITGNVVEIVAGGGVEVNTTHQELSDVVSGKQVTELPTLTRNPYALVVLSGNVAADPNGASGRGVGVSINGQRAASTNITLDGADNNDSFVAGVGQTVPLDSVQEFRVITSNFSAEYGRASGGIVNVATKSGTNNFHGTLFEFNRVAATASNGFDNNAQGNEKGGFTRNQFGYSLGGPIKKDKLQFFSSTEWTRVRSTGPVINVVPTPQLIAASNAATQSFFAPYKLARPINGTVYTVGDVVASLGGAGAFGANSPFATLPANTPAFGQTKFSIPTDQGAGSPQNTYQTNSRVDWNISDKTQVYGRYALDSRVNAAGSLNYSPYDGFDSGQTIFNNNFLISVTRTITPNLISQSKLTYNRLNLQQPLGKQAVSPTLYLTGGTARIRSFLLSFPGYSQFTPGNAIPFGGPQNVGQVAEDVNWNKGKHQFRFGGQYVYLQDNRAFGAYENATEQLGANTVSGLNNFVRGQLTIFQAAVFPQGKFPGDTLTLPVGPPDFTRSNRYHDFAFYGNDAWRVKPHLTLNLGIRWEYFGVQHNKDPKKDSNFYFGSGSSLQERIRNGKVQIAQDSPVGGLWQKDLNNFAPRIGFAWDVFGNGKTSLRGGYGIAYERNFGNVTYNVIQNPPSYAVVSLLAGTDVPSIAVTPNNAGPLAGASGSKVLPTVSLRWVRPDIVTAFSSFYSVALQRELFSRTVVSLEFTGSVGSKLYSLENYNRTGFGSQYLNSSVARPPALGGTVTRLNGQYGNINERGNGGYSRFRGLVAGLESTNFRSSGLQLTAKYRYSVARDNLSTTFSESANSFNLGLLDPFNNRLDYGYADFDVRHIFTLGYNWEIPFAKGMHGIGKQILHGWSFNGILTAQTGSPFTTFDCSNGITVCLRLVPTGTLQTTGSGNPKDTGDPNRFNFISLSNQKPSDFTDKSGGVEVGPYPTTMTARNLFRGPGQWNLDLGIYKKFFLTERYELQFRGEMYNAFNHANLFAGVGEADISSLDFVPASRFGRRHVQLALKLQF